MVALNGKAPAKANKPGVFAPPPPGWSRDPRAGKPVPTDPAAGPDDPWRQQAYAQLMAQANARGDAGSSASMVQGILGRADLGRHSRVGDMWNEHNSVTQQAFNTMLGGVQGAYAAQAAKARGGIGRGGGTGTLGANPQPPVDPYVQMLLNYYNSQTRRINETGGSGSGHYAKARVV